MLNLTSVGNVMPCVDSGSWSCTRTSLLPSVFGHATAPEEDSSTNAPDRSRNLRSAIQRASALCVTMTSVAVPLLTDPVNEVQRWLLPSPDPDSP